MFHEGFEQRGDNGWSVGINADTGAQRTQTLSGLEAQPGSVLHQVSAPVRAGQEALQVTVPHALGSFRSEIARPPVAMGSQWWYGFSIYLPASWQQDSQGNILAQWHSILPAGHTPGDSTGQPPVALAVVGDQWQLKLHWNTQGPSFSGAGKGTRTYDLGAIQPGQWADFVVHATWSHAADGLTQVWLDGHQAVDYSGPNEYATAQGPYFKIGIYHPDWKSFEAAQFNADTSVTRPIVVYDDEIRIAQAPATYESVVPR